MLSFITFKSIVTSIFYFINKSKVSGASFIKLASESIIDAYDLMKFTSALGWITIALIAITIILIIITVVMAVVKKNTNKPIQQIQPMQQVQPVQPGQSVQQVQLGQPGQQGQQVQPGQPVQQVQPGQQV